jgi:hypothetical protein
MAADGASFVAIPPANHHRRDEDEKQVKSPARY